MADDIKFEPKLALDGGNDGLDVIKKVIYKSKDILKLMEARLRNRKWAIC